MKLKYLGIIGKCIKNNILTALCELLDICENHFLIPESYSSSIQSPYNQVLMSCHAFLPLDHNHSVPGCDWCAPCDNYYTVATILGVGSCSFYSCSCYELLNRCTAGAVDVLQVHLRATGMSRVPQACPACTHRAHAHSMHSF